MNTEGQILNINEAFHLRFGYNVEDLQERNFSILFTAADKMINKPGKELQAVLESGSCSDENYLVHKGGNKVWVFGESVLIENSEDEKFIVKVIHNIHAQKQLERFLLESHEFIENIFDSIDESALMLLDSRIRVIKVNNEFVTMFELNKPVTEGCRLSEIENAFWQQPDVKQEAVNFLVMHNKTEEKVFELEKSSGEIKKISFRAKMIEGIPGVERKLLIMLKYV